MSDFEWQAHLEAVKIMEKRYPDIPTEVWDIEASDEMASMYYEDMSGY